MAGITLARTSRDQIRAAAPGELATSKPGDLVYYPGHVMMSLGIGGAVVHSPQTGGVVEVITLSAKRQRNVRVGNPIG